MYNSNRKAVIDIHISLLFILSLHWFYFRFASNNMYIGKIVPGYFGSTSDYVSVFKTTLKNSNLAKTIFLLILSR